MIRETVEPAFTRRIFALALLLAGGLCPLADAHDPDGPLLPTHFELIPLPNDQFDTVAFAFTPQGGLLSCSKVGRVRYHDGQQVQPTNFLDLTAEVQKVGDRGLLGIALQPGFLPDGGPTSWVYLLYTVSPVPGTDPLYNENDMYSFGRLTRYRAIDSGGNLVADPASRQILLGEQLPDGTVPDGIASLHNSHSNGSLRFADDGSLLLSTGDGAHWDILDGGGNDPAGFDDFVHPTTGLLGPTPAAQDQGAFRSRGLESLAGKVLRIDPDTGEGYPSNPFYDGDTASIASRIWATGLRNPYRMQLRPGTGSLDPADGEPNTIYIGDVGWTEWEEINVCQGGENFGWPCFEGPLPQPSYSLVGDGEGPPGALLCDSAAPGLLTMPLLAWDQQTSSLLSPPGFHVDGEGAPLGGFIGSCVIGGVFYEGGEYPEFYDGRLFFADFSRGWMKTLEVTGDDELVEVREFGMQVSGIVDIERHPLTGDIYISRRTETPNGNPYRIYQLRYGLNATPLAVALATPDTGEPPLMISFTGSLSTDADGDDLTYLWDFGDGQSSTLADTSHLYREAGQYFVTLTVTDPLGQSDQETVELLLGVDLPVITIANPTFGLAIEAPAMIPLVASATSTGGAIVSAEWIADLFHDTHTHTDVWSSTDPMPTFQVESHGLPGEVFYYRLRYTVVDQLGISASSHVFIYPEQNLRDYTGIAPVIVSDDADSGIPQPAAANPDFEVVRDGDSPLPGEAQPQRQYVTVPDPLEPQEWIGFEFQYTPPEELRFTGLRFQEGLHYMDGGWFEDFTVEVRLPAEEESPGQAEAHEGELWVEVESLRVDPPYPFELAAQAGFDGISFETYELLFDPVYGEAIRLRGTPGGTGEFASVGELRFTAIVPLPVDPPTVDITGEGEVIARVFELDPPLPQGVGNPLPGTISNGTFPPKGSQSSFAQFDTFHPQGSGTDWIGYRFPTLRQFAGLIFQEGLQFSQGGWLDTLQVQYRLDQRDPWSDVTGLLSNPPYPGAPSVTRTYEIFLLDFEPVIGREIRIAGVPAGTVPFISVGELRVLGPTPGPDCGWTPYGEGAGGANSLSLSAASIPALGAAQTLEFAGAPSPGPGQARLSFSEASLPLFGGTLLVGPSNLPAFPLSFDGQGEATLELVLPDVPALLQASLYFQGARVETPVTGGVFLSNGLRLRVCQ